MRTLYLLLFIYTGLFLSACSTLDHPSKAAKKQHKPTQQAAAQTKDPFAVAVYSKDPPLPYTVVGTAVVSEYNHSGIKRQEACIRDAMRNKAAKMGGDAVIHLDKDGKMVRGTVVAFQSEKNRLS